jgi:hypothetical protein
MAKFIYFAKKTIKNVEALGLAKVAARGRKQKGSLL